MAREYRYSNIDIDFNKNDFINDVSVKKDRNAVRQSVMNIVLTRPGEKPFLRDFGVGIHDMLFENFTEMDVAFLEKNIAANFARYEPRAALEYIDIDTDLIDNNQVSINIFFVILTGAEADVTHDSIRIGLNKVR